MIFIDKLTYKLPNNTVLFENLTFSIKNNEKIALIGKNGIGKSTIFKLINKELIPFSGKIKINELNITYLQQKINDLTFSTVADVFNLEKQVIALQKIEEGKADLEDYDIIDGYWDCREIIDKKLEFFDLKFDYLRAYNLLSGGEKIKIILSSIINGNTNFLILDEPTNNMDFEGKRLFYNFIKDWKGGIFLISHDRELLNLMDKIFELRNFQNGSTKLFSYGGNFDNYKRIKEIEENNLNNELNDSVKNLENQKQQIVKIQQNYIKNKKNGEKALKNGKIDKLTANFKKNSAEKQRGKIINRDNKKLEEINKKTTDIKEKIEADKKIYFKFSESKKIVNKKVLDIENLNFSYGERQILKNFNLIINFGDRIAINGVNGAGKTTLLRIITGEITNYEGILKVNLENIAYLRQNQTFSKNITILEYIIGYSGLNELECRNILAMFLFKTDSVLKNVNDLSGGEKIRFLLCCVLARKNIELIILDEPTNNLDIDSVEILEAILNNFNGAILVVSHDEVFKKNIKINDNVYL